MSRTRRTGRRDNRPVTVPQNAQPPEHRIRLTTVERHGPMPDAEELAAYEKVVPGLAHRIAVQWETETAFRRSITVEQLGDDRNHRLAGMALGFLLQFLVFVLAFKLATAGNNTGSGVFLACGSVASLTAIWKSWHLGKDDDK